MLVMVLGLAALLPETSAHAAARGRFQPSQHPAIPLGVLTLRVIGAPVTWLAGWLGGSGTERARLESGALAREDGWKTLGFRLDDSGRGVMLEIRGRTEVGAVEIVFEDGELRRVAHGAAHAYGRGLYEIADFGDERRVMMVRCAARARSPRATLRVLLTRDAPPAS